MKYSVRRFGISSAVSLSTSACILLTASIPAQADKLDDCVAAQMRDHPIAGLSFAIIDGRQDHQGAMVMINADDDSQAKLKIVDAIAKAYHWPKAR
jgi:hypothetical protein